MPRRPGESCDPNHGATRAWPAPVASAKAGAMRQRIGCQSGCKSGVCPTVLRAEAPMKLLMFAATLCSMAPAAATSFLIPATNPGAITGSGRDLSFDLSAVGGTIVAARLDIEIAYSPAREVSLDLIDGTGVVELPVANFAGLNPIVGLSGRYRIDDRAQYPWIYAAAVPNVQSLAPVQAFQQGQAGVCTNLVGRYLEYDIDRNQVLTLRVTRAAGASGAGTIGAARLHIETGQADQLTATGFEELDLVVDRCQRPSFDLIPNGGSESLARSPVVLLDYAGGAPDWLIGQIDPPATFGPFPFGVGVNTAPYAGRFGGRSRMNLGFWDAATGALNFSTGAGARNLALPGDWLATQHLPIPGDYDGDGVTDLAMAFLGSVGGQPRWIGRFLLSADGSLKDIQLDPRSIFPAQFNSGQIGFGAGQDVSGDGRDEVTIYAQTVNGGMGQMQVEIQRDGTLNYFSGPFWGLLGDRVVLGNWVGGISGNRYGLMVVRKNAGVLEWYLFPNPTPTLWGFSSDFPLSIDVDEDERNDIAVWRPSDQKVYAIRSSDGAQISYAPIGDAGSVPLAYLLGTTAPLEF